MFLVKHIGKQLIHNLQLFLERHKLKEIIEIYWGLHFSTSVCNKHEHKQFKWRFVLEADIPLHSLPLENHIQRNYALCFE